MTLSAKKPIDWKRNTFSNSLSVLKDGTHFSPKTFGGKNLYITSKNIRMGKLDLEDVSYIPDEEHQRIYSASPVKYGDVLLTKDGAKTGNVCINTLQKEFSLLSSVAYLRGKTDLLLNEFLLQWLSSPRVQYDIKNDMAGQAITRLTLQKIGKFKILLPPLSEQRAIADLLSTWDEAIEKTERLIQAKEKRFKRLLNDLIYIPTKQGKWRQVRTKSLFKERKETNRGDLPLLSITNGEGVIPHGDTNRKDTSNEDKSKYLRICAGDIGYNTMRMWQGVSALSSLEGIVSPAYTICIPGEKLCPLFVSYLFKMPFMIHKFYRYSQGLTSDTWNLKFHHFSEVRMPLPALEEQERITETLSSARREIDLLKQLAKKYKTQKRGLMQKMLTGEWRVKPEIVKNFEGGGS